MGIWADGVYSGLRAADAKLCALVIIGVNERGEKHLLAIDDGIRESTQSWREVLLDGTLKTILLCSDKFVDFSVTKGDNILSYK